MKKVFITAAVIITAFSTQSCAESLNDYYTGLLIADHSTEKFIAKS